MSSSLDLSVEIRMPNEWWKGMVGQDLRQGERFRELPRGDSLVVRKWMCLLQQPSMNL